MLPSKPPVSYCKYYSYWKDECQTIRQVFVKKLSSRSLCHQYKAQRLNCTRESWMVHGEDTALATKAVVDQMLPKQKAKVRMQWPKFKTCNINGYVRTDPFLWLFLVQIMMLLWISYVNSVLSGNLLQLL